MGYFDDIIGTVEQPVAQTTGYFDDILPDAQGNLKQTEIKPTPVSTGYFDDILPAQSTPEGNRFVSTRARTTGYHGVSPDDPRYKMEGGHEDRKGNPLHTMDAFHRGEVPWVTLAGDPRIPYGTPATSPQFPGVPFRVNDTGSAFKGAGLSHFDVARDTAEGANSDENNREVQFDLSDPGFALEQPEPDQTGAVPPESEAAEVMAEPEPAQPIDIGVTPYGLREDGTPKGDGFFGKLSRPDGEVSTELSVGVEINGKETLIPSLVPTLSKSEVDSLLNMKDGEMPSPEIIAKAKAFAEQRIAQGKSPFAEKGEQGAPPAGGYTDEQRKKIVDDILADPTLPQKYADAAMNTASAPLLEVPQAEVKQADSAARKLLLSGYNAAAGLVSGTTSDAGITSILNPLAGLAGMVTAVPDLIKQAKEARKTPLESPERYKAFTDIAAFLALPVVIHAGIKAFKAKPKEFQQQLKEGGELIDGTEQRTAGGSGSQGPGTVGGQRADAGGSRSPSQSSGGRGSQGSGQIAGSQGPSQVNNLTPQGPLTSQPFAGLEVKVEPARPGQQPSAGQTKPPSLSKEVKAEVKQLRTQNSLFKILRDCIGA